MTPSTFDEYMDLYFELHERKRHIALEYQRNISETGIMVSNNKLALEYQRLHKLINYVHNRILNSYGN